MTCLVAAKMASHGWLEQRLGWALTWQKKTGGGSNCWEKSVRLKMENHEPDGTIKENLIDIKTRKINQLPEAERNLLENGSIYWIYCCSLGLIANSLFRCILHVTQARIAAGLPMAVIQFLTANVSYKGFVSLPLNTGDLHCETCTITLAGLAGLVFSGLYLVFLAIPVNGGLAARYNSALLPEKGNILNYWIRTSKPVFKKMLFPILLQTGFASYLGSRQYKLLIKALQLPRSWVVVKQICTQN